MGRRKRPALAAGDYPGSGSKYFPDSEGGVASSPCHPRATAFRWLRKRAPAAAAEAGAGRAPGIFACFSSGIFLTAVRTQFLRKSGPLRRTGASSTPVRVLRGPVAPISSCARLPPVILLWGSDAAVTSWYDLLTEGWFEIHRSARKFLPSPLSGSEGRVTSIQMKQNPRPAFLPEFPFFLFPCMSSENTDTSCRWFESSSRKDAQW